MSAVEIEHATFSSHTPRIMPKVKSKNYMHHVSFVYHFCNKYTYIIYSRCGAGEQNPNPQHTQKTTTKSTHNRSGSGLVPIYS